ncbi:MAG: alkaline phosphatase family protein [Pseudopedobacter saltans]|uniref:Alkaline phosphatase family protein n=1 Tax=Pseudopedobacter saltans TaxID=151895 RepID=A0A2W5F7X2_9SPHI|nr:MAG: alkaline phosphatase family protein [Pseudopedobacter saltans]
MSKISISFLFLFQLFCGLSNAQSKSNNKSNSINNSLSRPKLVVGIVVDQMRWDYLYRYHDLYSNTGGFKRLLGEGFSCENTFIPYIPTVTAAGHTCIYTGSIPAIHGIVGNNWYDNIQKKDVYCTDDSTVSTVGSTTVGVGKMSPRNMFATTIGDELRLATNFRSKVIAISCKDRASILPGGHNPNGAYWYDNKTGKFVTSTYYRQDLPNWVEAFNNRKIVDSLYALNWNLAVDSSLYPIYSTDDSMDYEGAQIVKGQTTFPYQLSQFIGNDYSKIMYTPYANTMTTDMAIAALKGEQLGISDVTDMLAVSYSAPDYIGHTDGPNSWEQMDDYIRLDKEIGKLLSNLDATVGKGNYTVFLSADHGAAHAGKFSQMNSLPGGSFSETDMKNDMNEQLKNKYGFPNIIRSISEYQIAFNYDLLNRTENINREDLTNWVIRYLLERPEVASAFSLNKTTQALIPEVQKQRTINGYFAQRSGDIQFIAKPGYFGGSSKGTTHGSWNPYDSHIPLVWYGWGIKHGETNRETYMTDIAATIAALLHIQMPSGCVGTVISEIMK